MKKIDSNLIKEYDDILKKISDFKGFSKLIFDNSDLELISKLLEKAESEFNARKNFILNLYSKK